MFSKASSERVQILIIRDFLSHIFEVLFHSFFKSVLVITNVEVTTAFTCDFVNKTASTTSTFIYTTTVYFRSWVSVALSTEKAATRAHILPGLTHTSLISINMLCDAGWKVEYDTSDCRVIFKHGVVWKGRLEPTTGLWVLPLDPTSRGREYYFEEYSFLQK